MQRSYRTQRQGRLSPRLKRILLVSVIAILGLFIVVNVVLWLVYRDRTYPRTKVMSTTIGSTAYDDLSKKVSELEALPMALKLTHDKQKTTLKLTDFGITKDVRRTVESANEQRSWLPIANVFSSPELQAPIAINDKKFIEQTAKLAATFRKDAVNASLSLNGTVVTIVNPTDGYELSQKQLQAAVVRALDKGKDMVAAPVSILKPKVTVTSLKDDKQKLEGQLNTSITYRYNGKIIKPTKEDIAKWFVQSGEVYVISKDSINAYVLAAAKNNFGIRVKEVNQVVDSTEQAVANGKTLDTTLTAQIAVKTYTYCTAVKGVAASHLPALRAKAQSTLADSRGWGLNGLVEYKEVTSGCDFTLWLSAADQMPSFGAICDAMWSCRVGPNVVINFDRWQNASPSWNANGGSLEDYRYMVINHETGHWLGFGHGYCPGAGQAAPVMQQQSIDLQGCKFSPWPTSAELSTLRQKLGI